MLISSKEPGFIHPVLFFVALLGFTLSFWMMKSLSLDPRVREVCDLVYQKHYVGESALRTWHQKCLSQLPAGKSDQEIVTKFTLLLDEIPGSHLNIYDESQNKEAWEGVAGHTGLFVRSVNGRFFVYKVDPKSSVSGRVRVGDEVLSVSGEQLLSEYIIERVPGEFTFVRRGSSFTEKVILNEIQLDRGPKLKGHVLRISSFRKEYFETAEWKALLKRAQGKSKLWIDLRGNRGGEFEALTRAISGFLCEENDFGSLVSPRAKNRDFVVFEDEGDKESKISLIGKVFELKLRAFKDYPCYRGNLKIVIDSKTASSAEIFAEALREQRDATLLGEVTSGEVLVGVWYNLQSFKTPYVLSIPEAIFVSSSGRQIEAQGVQPDQFLFYEEEDMIRGVDAWIR